MESKFFTAVEIFPNVRRIGGMGGENAYLVEGTERALLIDGLTGVGSLKAFVRELTELPVQLVITHGHVDHAGAIYEFGEGYINPDDIALMYSPMHSDPEARLNFAKSGAAMGAPLRTTPTMADVIPPRPVKTWPVYDGDVFDLGGGTQLEVIQVPGHTYGTIILLDRAHRVIYSGDACNVNTLLNLEGSTSIEEYRASLEHLLTYVPDFDHMWGGHGPAPMPSSAVADAIVLCDRILAGTDDAVERQMFGTAYYASGVDMFELMRQGKPNIAYSREHIRRAPRPAIQDGPHYSR